MTALSATQKLRAPFPYFGGKSKVAPLVWSRLGDVRNYVEPFFGSGAMLLGRPDWPFENGNRIETVNDKDCFLANFWRALKNAPDEVAEHADWPVNECVPAGTVISTPNGEVPVERITEGMTVWGFNGESVVPTRVIATKQSHTHDRFTRVGNLSVTSNHPVWTAEHGYIEAARLKAGMVVKKLVYNHHDASMGHIHAGGPSNRGRSLCRDDIPLSEAVHRTSVAGKKRGSYLPRLLDTVLTESRNHACHRVCRVRSRRRMAGRRATVDCLSRGVRSIGESNLWRRRSSGVYSDSGASRFVVTATPRGEVCSRKDWRNDGAHSYSGGASEDFISFNRAETHGRKSSQTVDRPQGKAAYCGASEKAERSQDGATAYRGAQTEDRIVCCGQKGGPLCQYRPDIRIHHRGIASAGCIRGVGKPSDSKTMPLSRESSSVCVSRAVYNFQTAAGNYFASGVLVHNCDLHARHLWLVNVGREHVEKLRTDPEYFDVKIAGWWVWGICQWIGSGWCHHPEWKQLPHLGDAGMGIHRPSQQLPHLGDAGRGIHRPSQQLPHLGNAGRGIHRPSQQLPHLGNALGNGIVTWQNRGELYEYFDRLAARLSRVRICCGDWQRVCGPTPTVKQGLTGVFLDPPYNGDAKRKADLYAVDDLSVSNGVRKWCLENGSDKRLRIAFAGYAGEGHEELEQHGWDVVAWKARGGYGSQGSGDDTNGRDNAKKERIWFSPHCLKPHEGKPCELQFS